jgi:hypothetical protein
MKALDLTHYPFHNILSKLHIDSQTLSFNGLLTDKLNNVFHFINDKSIANKAFVNSTYNYLLKAANEGFKQTFLGFDINIEFIMLTLRANLKSAKQGLSEINSIKIPNFHVTDKAWKYLTNRTHSLHN